MSIIKAKYPSLKRPYMFTEEQGYGAYRGGNVSNITEINTERALEFINESDWLKEN